MTSFWCLFLLCICITEFRPIYLEKRISRRHGKKCFTQSVEKVPCGQARPVVKDSQWSRMPCGHRFPHVTNTTRPLTQRPQGSRVTHKPKVTHRPRVTQSHVVYLSCQIPKEPCLFLTSHLITDGPPRRNHRCLANRNYNNAM